MRQNNLCVYSVDINYLLHKDKIICSSIAPITKEDF